MFEKVIIALILVLAAILVFSGCSDMENKAEQLENEIESRPDPVEDAIESKADSVEDAIEDAVENILTDVADASAPTNEAETLTDALVQDDTVPADTTAVTNPAQDSIDKVAGLLGDILKEQASGVTVPDSVPDSGASSSCEQTVFITPEAAQQLALDHAGVAAADAVFDRTERDYDNGVWHYEVEFRVGLTEYEYDIHAETGAVLSFEKDR